MEELKMDADEKIKGISMEDDILGGQSLLMSESDDDGNGDTSKDSNKSPVKKKSLKRSKRILLGSDEATQEEQHNREVGIEIYEKKQDEEEIVNKTTKKKFCTLIDSDSENYETGKQIETDIKSKNSLKGLVNYESENNREYEKDELDSETRISKKLQKRYRKLNKSTQNLKSNKSDSDQNSAKTHKKSKKSVRKVSAKKALDEMQAIQSEQQRLRREAHISAVNYAAAAKCNTQLSKGAYRVAACCRAEPTDAYCENLFMRETSLGVHSGYENQR